MKRFHSNDRDSDVCSNGKGRSGKNHNDVITLLLRVVSAVLDGNGQSLRFYTTF